MITIAEVMGEVRRSPWADSSSEMREQRLRELYTNTLNAMIDRKLILSAAKNSKMELQGWAVDNRIREIVADNFDGDRTRLHALLAERKIDYEEWHKTIEEDLMITAFRYQQVEKYVTPTPGEIRAEYDANRSKYQTESAVAVSMIILDPPASGEKSVAERGSEIKKALTAGESFGSLAMQYSKDSRAAKGGSWGKVNPDDVFRSEIVKVLEGLKPGETSELLVLEEYGYIVRKDEQQDARMLTYEEAAPYVESNLRMKLSDKLYKSWIERLRTEAYIRVFELPKVN
jgi:parvulin-like peptidyl-prolyl isomerase